MKRDLLFIAERLATVVNENYLAEARLAALERTAAFDNIEHRTSTWQLFINPDQTVALYATYSNVIIRPDREEVLNELHRIVHDEFQSLVTRNIVTSLYVARRRPNHSRR